MCKYYSVRVGSLYSSALNTRRHDYGLFAGCLVRKKKEHKKHHISYEKYINTFRKQKAPIEQDCCVPKIKMQNIDSD